MIPPHARCWLCDEPRVEGTTRCPAHLDETQAEIDARMERVLMEWHHGLP